MFSFYVLFSFYFSFCSNSLFWIIIWSKWIINLSNSSIFDVSFIPFIVCLTFQRIKHPSLRIYSLIEQSFAPSDGICNSVVMYYQELYSANLQLIHKRLRKFNKLFLIYNCSIADYKYHSTVRRFIRLCSEDISDRVGWMI